jgi:hypothetical protein
MDTHTTFTQHIKALLDQAISMRAIAKKTGIDYTRLRNVYYPGGKTTAKKEELTAIEEAYRSELLLDYSEEDKALIEDLQTTVKVLSAQKDGYKKMVGALTHIIEQNPEMKDWKEVKQLIEELKKLN